MNPCCLDSQHVYPTGELTGFSLDTSKQYSHKKCILYPAAVLPGGDRNLTALSGKHRAPSGSFVLFNLFWAQLAFPVIYESPIQNVSLLYSTPIWNYSPPVLLFFCPIYLFLPVCFWTFNDGLQNTATYQKYIPIYFVPCTCYVILVLLTCNYHCTLSECAATEGEFRRYNILQQNWGTFGLPNVAEF